MISDCKNAPAFSEGGSVFFHPAGTFFACVRQKGEYDTGGEAAECRNDPNPPPAVDYPGKPGDLSLQGAHRSAKDAPMRQIR